MGKSRAMYKQLKIRCPNCSAVVLTMQPESMIWEQCPSCGVHRWDSYDLLMAESTAGSALCRAFFTETGN
jgi:hypothetical protein